MIQAQHIEAEFVGDGQDIFIVVQGVKIARRGRPNTPEAKTWVSLEPGWSVLDGPRKPDGSGSFRIEYDRPQSRDH